MQSCTIFLQVEFWIQNDPRRMSDCPDLVLPFKTHPRAVLQLPWQCSVGMYLLQYHAITIPSKNTALLENIVYLKDL